MSSVTQCPVMNRKVEVLLVEDDEGDVLLMEGALERDREHIRLHHAQNGEEALQFLRKQEKFMMAPRPDLMVLDLNMPKKNGLEVLKEVGEDPELRTIPVVVFTTSASEKDIRESYQLHANCVITKPGTLEEFTEVVRSMKRFWLTVAQLPNSIRP